jgi:hypothetical protein
MGNEVFHLTTLTRFLEGDARLADVFGLPEISPLEESERKCRATLQVKSKSILADPESTPPRLLFRRRFGATVAVDVRRQINHQ